MSAMTAANSFKVAKGCLAKRLESYGFAGTGNTLWRRSRDTVVVFETQKDRYSTKDEVRFTINVGISVDALRIADAASGGPPSTEIPLPEACHWRARLGRLLSAQGDMWWSVCDEQSAQSVCDELATGLIDVALPQIDEVASSEALVRLWQEGRGYGLTEYERRSNLAKLLCTLNRKEEAEAAIHALEEASLGKSWEISAKYDATKLRKYLA